MAVEEDLCGWLKLLGGIEDLCGWLKLLGGISNEPRYGTQTQIIDDVIGDRFSPPARGFKDIVVGVATHRARIINPSQGLLTDSDLDSANLSTFSKSHLQTCRMHIFE